MEKHTELIQECKKGNRKAQHKLYDLYSKAMFNTSYRMMHNKELAEDMLQEAFCQAFMSINTFRYESTFGSWLKRILINHCINEIKRRKVELVFMDDLQKIFPDQGDIEDLESGINLEDVKKAMEDLPTGARTVFSLYLLEGYDHEEISEILNISKSAAKSQYSRAKSKIRKILNNGGAELMSSPSTHHKKVPFTTVLSQFATNKAVLQHI